MMDLHKAQKRSQEVNSMFKKMRGMDWNPEVMITDMMEEVGELATRILVDRGYKTKKDKKVEDLADCLCDILFDIFMIAEHYDVDMETEYEKVLRQLASRIKKGKFSEW
jgi:NTP pyrophosphatase (non-canonical NTP hydrolase)